MSKIYFKVTVEKKRCTQNFDFKSSKSLSPGQFLESSNSCRYHWVLKLLASTYKLVVLEQKCVRLFYYFNFERNYDALKLNGPCFLLNKKNKL